MLIESRVVFFFATPSRRKFTVTGRRPVVMRGPDKAGNTPPATAMGRYFKPKFLPFLHRSPINYIFPHVVAGKREAKVL